MPSMPATSPYYDESAEPERVPLAHGLTAVIIRYRDDEPRPERPTHLLPREARQQAELNKWLAQQKATSSTGGGGAA